MIKNIPKKLFMLLKKEKKVPVVEVARESDLLSRKVTLITGGSGGIGRTIARQIIAAGGKVILSGRNEKTLNEICEALGCVEAVRYIRMDFDRIGSFEDRLRVATELFPEKRIDILVNCAGVIDHHGFLDVSEEVYDRVMDTNLKGTYFMCQAFSKYLIDNGMKGHILNLSSSSALRPASTPYSISKWGIRGLTQGLADVLLPYGIVVNAIGPGPTATEMLGVGEGDTIYHPTNPSRRYATPEEIANLAVLLISGAGDMVVGDTFYITGGSGITSLHG